MGVWVSFSLVGIVSLGCGRFGCVRLLWGIGLGITEFEMEHRGFVRGSIDRPIPMGIVWGIYLGIREGILKGIISDIY